MRQDGHAASAVHIALGNLAEQLEAAVPAKSSTVVLYCRSGRRSATGAQTAGKMGYGTREVGDLVASLV